MLVWCAKASIVSRRYHCFYEIADFFCLYANRFFSSIWIYVFGILVNTLMYRDITYSRDAVHQLGNCTSHECNFLLFQTILSDSNTTVTVSIYSLQWVAIRLLYNVNLANIPSNRIIFLNGYTSNFFSFGSVL